MKDTQNKMEPTTCSTREDVVVTDNNYLTTTDDDKYSESIDLSNACREFYQSRKRAAEAVKEKLAHSGRQRPTKSKTSIDVAMETLRSEMSSLMDQDLSLMKQLLTLNEAIEDLKWQKKYYHSQSSMPDSSCDLNESDWSVSETDMYDSESEALRKYPTVSALSSLHSSFDDRRVSETRLKRQASSKTGSPSVKSCARDIPKDLDYFLTSTACHEEQNSFDSGIHEPVHREEITV